VDSQLKAVAYSVTGSWADAEEIVQEAHLRLLNSDRNPDSESAYLYRVVCNLAYDQLRKEKVRRKHYFGPWLPEPVADVHFDQVEFQQDLTMGFMLLLELLSPAERIVFVLREVFDFKHTEISRILVVPVATIRQRYSRARNRLDKMAANKPDAKSPPFAVKALLEQMMALVLAGDVDGFVELMTEDAVALTDGGGVVNAAIQPVSDPQRIAKVVMHLVEKNLRLDEIELSLEPVNRSWALVIKQSGEFHSLTTLAVEDGKIHRIYVVRNPVKAGALLGTHAK
jgi:RNA polymerase sigma-70 factor (ECF subfamily)